MNVIERNNSCTHINYYLEQTLIVVMFLLGYLFFKNIIFKENPENESLKALKSRKTLEYLESYRREDEEFFFRIR